MNLRNVPNAVETSKRVSCSLYITPCDLAMIMKRQSSHNFGQSLYASSQLGGARSANLPFFFMERTKVLNHE